MKILLCRHYNNFNHHVLMCMCHPKIVFPSFARSGSCPSQLLQLQPNDHHRLFSSSSQRHKHKERPSVLTHSTRCVSNFHSIVCYKRSISERLVWNLVIFVFYNESLITTCIIGLYSVFHNYSGFCINP